MKITYANLLTPTEAANQLFCNERTLANWRCQEKGPCFTKMPNGRVYYPQEEVDKFLNECVKKNESNNSKMLIYPDIN